MLARFSVVAVPRSLEAWAFSLPGLSCSLGAASSLSAVVNPAATATSIGSLLCGVFWGLVKPLPLSAPRVARI